MNIFEVLRLSWKSIVVNKLRSLLTMLGVIIGVAAVIVMMAVSAGTEATIAEKINGLGSNLVFINSAFTRGGPNMGPQSLQGGLVYDDLLAIRERINGVAGATVEQETRVSLKYGTTTLEEVSLIGTTPDYPTVRNVEVANGRFVTDSDQERTAKVIILGSDIATQIFGEDDPVGQSIYVNNVKMNIVGVLAPKGLSGGTDFDQLIYAPIATVFKKFTPSQFARIQGTESARSSFRWIRMPT
jgi:putative ABC transport system permease protein